MISPLWVKLIGSMYGIFTYLVGGFNPFEKYSSNWVHLPQIRVKMKIYSKPPTDYLLGCPWYLVTGL